MTTAPQPDANPADRFLPHPRAGWYDREIGTTGGDVRYPFNATVEQRRSYVRFILAGHGGARSHELRELADWEPSALAPWADHVADFDDAALDQLAEVEWPDYWRATRNASDDAVDRLAARIAAAPPAGSYRPEVPGGPEFARVHLLVGVDSERALARLAELAREHDVVNEICASYGVWVPPDGPAVRRYVSQPQRVVSGSSRPEPGLRVLPPVGDLLVDPRGPGCALPLSVVLDVDLTLLPGNPLAGAPQRSHPFIGSFCSGCDADEELRAWRGWRLVTEGEFAGRVEFDEERDEECPGHEQESDWETPSALALLPSDRYAGRGARGAAKVVATLGGWPNWAQYPVWPDCCDRPMFFVGQTGLAVFGGVDAHLYGFACECGAGAQISQNT